MSPFFSIIIPVYNRENKIENTINSCLSQTFTDFEIIIIDDCSTDATVEVIKSIHDERIKLLQNQVNSERCVSRNRGIEFAKGKYICFLDSDDLFLPNHLLTFYEELEKMNFQECMIFSNSYLQYEGKELLEKRVDPFQFTNRFAYLLEYTPNPARVCVSTSIVQQNLFDKNIPGIEDLDLWLRIALKYPIYHLEKYSNVYSIHDEMYSISSKKKFSNELRMFTYVANKPELKNILPKSKVNRLKSMCYFLSNFAFESRERWKTIYYASLSFYLCPKGYNGRTNKILLANTLYSTPLIGFLIKKSIRFSK